jgi:hypothetical protein
MYGDLTFTFPVSRETGGATEPGRFVAGRNGRYRTDHQYASAVGLLGYRSRRADYIHDLLAEHDDLGVSESMELLDEADGRGEIPDGGFHVVTLVTAASDLAVPVPEEFFDGHGDRVFALDEDSGAYVQIRVP